MNSKTETGFEAAFGALVEKIAQWTEQGELLATPVTGLSLFRRDEPSKPLNRTYEPSICLAVQGAKRVLVGNEVYVYDPGNYLITSVHLQTTVQVVKASECEPYLGMRLKFDIREVSRLMVDSNLPALSTQRPERGMALGKLTQPLVSALGRLIDLLHDEKDIPILAPVIQREIIYRLLIGDQGSRLRQTASAGSRSNQLALAIQRLKDNFKLPLQIDELAKEFGMSQSTFHHHFKSMTAMSPLQYQKRLRLQEARRLMLTEQHDSSAAAFEVGYESPSQFSREYNREFGAPPMRDIKTLRENAGDPVL